MEELIMNLNKVELNNVDAVKYERNGSYGKDNI